MRDKVKKTVKHTVLALCIVLVSVFVISSCDKLQRLRIDELAEAIKNMPCDCIMDTLKGEWVWFKTTGEGNPGNLISYNRFKSVIKILGQNPDSSINYEVWVRDTVSFFDPDFNEFHEIFVTDTLFSQGSFKIQDGWRGGKSAFIELPHSSFSGVWEVFWENSPWYWSLGKPGKDTLVFVTTTSNASFFYYEKIK